MCNHSQMVFMWDECWEIKQLWGSPWTICDSIIASATKTSPFMARRTNDILPVWQHCWCLGQIPSNKVAVLVKQPWAAGCSLGYALPSRLGTAWICTSRSTKSTAYQSRRRKDADKEQKDDSFNSFIHHWVDWTLLTNGKLILIKHQLLVRTMVDDKAVIMPSGGFGSANFCGSTSVITVVSLSKRYSWLTAINHHLGWLLLFFSLLSSILY